MRLLITGAAGRLGSRVTAHLAREHEVIALDISDPPASTPEGVAYIQADLRDAGRVREAVQGCEAVVHLGAIPGPVHYIPSAELYAINVQGTYHVLEAAARAHCRMVLLASSLCAIGFPPGLDNHGVAYLPVDEDLPCRPRDAYDLSKLINEKTAEMFSRTTDLATICVRFPALIDVRTSEWFLNAVRRDPPKLVLTEYLDFADANQVIELILARSDLEHEVFFVNADTAGTIIPTPEYITRFNPAVEWRGEPPSDTTPLINCAKAKRVLGFDPKVTWQSVAEQMG